MLKDMYFLFVQYWINTWIVTNAIIASQQQSDFNIHGIWLDYTNGSYPEYCSNVPFNVEALQPIWKPLSSHWTDMQNATEFLEHEWTKHGTCAQKYDPSIFKDELMYFSRGLAQWAILNLTQAFDELAIYSQNEYNVTDIKNKLSGYYGFEPVITCEEDDNTWLLDEIRMCYDETWHLQECPSTAYDDQCNESMIYLP